MNRRGFLGSILALGAAPAIVRADSLMRVVPVETTVLVPLTELVVTSTRSGNMLLSAEEISRIALQMARQKWLFLQTISMETNIAYDPHRDVSLTQTRILLPGNAKRIPDGDSIKIRLPGAGSE